MAWQRLKLLVTFLRDAAQLGPIKVPLYSHLPGNAMYLTTDYSGHSRQGWSYGLY